VSLVAEAHPVASDCAAWDLVLYSLSNPDFHLLSLIHSACGQTTIGKCAPWIHNLCMLLYFKQSQPSSPSPNSLCRWSHNYRKMYTFNPRPVLFWTLQKEKETTTQAVTTTPHIIWRKGAISALGTINLLHHQEEDQWGSGGLQAWPETGSWWELIIVLESLRLVRTSLAMLQPKCRFLLNLKAWNIFLRSPLQARYTPA
jgi:hypothetical protein